MGPLHGHSAGGPRWETAGEQATVPHMTAPKLKAVDDGTRLLLRGQAPRIEEANAVVSELLAQCPEHHHPWRVEIQKSRKGARAYITVTFQRNRNAPPLSTPRI